MSGIPAEPEPPVISLPAIRDPVSSASRTTVGPTMPGQVPSFEYLPAVDLGPPALAVCRKSGSHPAIVEYF